MSSLVYRYRSGTIVLAVAALAGLAISLYYLLTPLTGVTGTFGAGLVVFSTGIMLVATLLVPLIGSGAVRGVFRFLILLDVVCTAAAGYFLHEWSLIAAMVLALIGIVWEFSKPSSPHYPEGARA